MKIQAKSSAPSKAQKYLVHILIGFFLIYPLYSLTFSRPILRKYFKKEGRIESEYDNKTQKKIHSTNKINTLKASYRTLTRDGLKFYKEEKYKKALKVFLKIQEEGFRTKILYNNLCSTYNALGEYKKAITECEKAIEMDPSFELAANNLIWAREQLARRKYSRRK